MSGSYIDRVWAQREEIQDRLNSRQAFEHDFRRFCHSRGVKGPVGSNPWIFAKILTALVVLIVIGRFL